MSSDLRIRGDDYAGRSHHAPLRTRRDLDLFVQRAIDILCIAFFCAFVNLAGLAVAYAVYVCLFEVVS